MVWYLQVSLCALCMLSRFILINRRDAEHAKVLKRKSLLPPPSTFLCDLCALCGLFLNITAKHAEHAKALKGMFSSIFLRMRGTLCGLIGKRLTARLPSAKMYEKK